MKQKYLLGAKSSLMMYCLVLNSLKTKQLFNINNNKLFKVLPLFILVNDFDSTLRLLSSNGKLLLHAE